MSIYFHKTSVSLFALFAMSCLVILAQTEMTTDELYAKARSTAFGEDDYVGAIALTNRALAKSPDYLEVKVFLGRLYTFSDSLPQARMVFGEVLEKESGHEEASLAYGNLEYWNSNSERGLEIVNEGFETHPKSESLGMLKANILKDLKRYNEASTVLDNLLKSNPKLTEARALVSSINSVSVKNAIGLSYEYVYFDERFDNPWHLASIDYTRQTRLGSVAARVNYANRFKMNGGQFEMDAYPRISDLFYAYVNFGISKDEGIFPQYRAGFSLYANLPAAFEADAGFRVLAFDDTIWIYNLGVGKYYKNFWFNFLTYLTPSSSSVSQSYAWTTRYYLAGADDFLSLKLGTGISPDDNANSISFDPNNIYKLKSTNIVLGYRKLFWETNVLSLQVALENQKFAPGTKGNQLSLSMGSIKRF